MGIYKNKNTEIINKIIKKSIKNIGLVFCNLLLFLMFKILKLEKNKVVYIPVNFKYQGNAKALLNRWSQYDNFQHVYLCDEKIVNKTDELQKVIFTNFGLKFIYHLATAEFLVRESEYNSVGLLCRNETMVIQLWHASGAFKKFTFDLKRSSFLNIQRKRDIKTWDILFVSSENIVDIYSKAFGKIDRTKIFVCGLPRNDFLYNLKKKQNELKKNLSIGKDKKLILFAPTFRDKKSLEEHNFLVNTAKMLNRKLSKDMLLGVRFHPKISNTIEYNTKFIDLNQCETEEALAAADMLITDYSSIIFDYALLERPILFYVPDLDEYYKSRGFYYDYESFVPGPVCKTIDKLLDNIENYDSSRQIKKILKFKQRFNPFFNGKNTDIVLKKILELKKYQ